VYIDLPKWYNKTSIHLIFVEISVLRSNGKAADFRGLLLELLPPDAQIGGKHSTESSDASDMQRVPLTQHKSFHFRTVP
jgi:hypothetical protein